MFKKLNNFCLFRKIIYLEFIGKINVIDIDDRSYRNQAIHADSESKTKLNEYYAEQIEVFSFDTAKKPKKQLQYYNMQKNFLIKKYSNISHKKNTSFQSSSLILLSKSSSHSSTETLLTVKEIEKRVKEIWQVMRSMNVEISEQSILKYMKKTMQRKGYRHVEFILECIKNHKGIKLPSKTEEINYEQLIYELEDLKTEVEQFLWRKFCKDIDIIEEKIRMEDEQIRNSIELNQYQIITGSFHPHLISNPADLIEEFQNIGGHPTKRNCSRLQQMRYIKLTNAERNISNLHSSVCQAKQGYKIFN